MYPPLSSGSICALCQHTNSKHKLAAHEIKTLLSDAVRSKQCANSLCKAAYFFWLQQFYVGKWGFYVRQVLAYFSNASREVLNKKLAEVVQGVELTSLRHKEKDSE